MLSVAAAVAAAIAAGIARAIIGAAARTASVTHHNSIGPAVAFAIPLLRWISHNTTEALIDVIPHAVKKRARV